MNVTKEKHKSIKICEALESSKKFHFLYLPFHWRGTLQFVVNFLGTPNAPNMIFLDKQPISPLSKYKVRQGHEKQQTTKFNNFKQQNVTFTNKQNISFISLYELCVTI
jgi:hypothetical protein